MLKKKATIAAKIKERRTTTRLSLPLEIEIVASKSPLRNQRITVEDISGGGLRLFSNYPLKKKDKLTINLYFPDKKPPIKITTEVVWCSPREEGTKDSYALGVKFLKIPAADQERFIFSLCDLTVRNALLGKRA